MSNSAPSLLLLLAMLGALVLGSCGDVSAPPGATVEVEVAFESEVQGGHRRFLTIRDLSVAHVGPEYYDLRLESDRPAGMLISANGTRNITEVGMGDKRSFLQLVQQLGTWKISGLPEAAASVGITPGERPADYWTPGQHIVQPGTIIATRNVDPEIVSGDESREADIGSLVYVQSVTGKQKLVLLIARAPKPEQK